MMTLTWLMLLILWCWNSEYQSWWWRWWWWRCWSLLFFGFYSTEKQDRVWRNFSKQSKASIHPMYPHLLLQRTQNNRLPTKGLFFTHLPFFISGCYLFDQIFKYFLWGLSFFWLFDCELYGRWRLSTINCSQLCWNCSVKLLTADATHKIYRDRFVFCFIESFEIVSA